MKKTDPQKALNALFEIFDKVKLPVADGPNPSLVEAIASIPDVVGYVGWINHAGRVADGTYQVQFDVPGDGYSSRWPQWAYEIALSALLNNKKVWVIADGLPYGPNLLHVLPMHNDA